MTLQKQRDVIQAAIDGKEVEWRTSGNSWRPWNNDIHSFDFRGAIEYRIKPQPREWWAVIVSPSQAGWTGHLYTNEDSARNGLAASLNFKVVKVREVLE